MPNASALAVTPHVATAVAVTAVEFDYRPQHGDIPTIGPLRCRELRPVAARAGSCCFSPMNMNLGNYTGVLSQTGAATMTVTCPNNVAYNIGLNAGAGLGATVTNRRLTQLLVATLPYGLYRDSARSLNWGNTSGTDTLSGTGTGSAQTGTVYPQLPPALIPIPSRYLYIGHIRPAQR